MSQIVRVLAALLLFGAVAERTAAAVIYTGGDVTVTSLVSDAAFTSDVGLYSSSGALLRTLTSSASPGQVITFNPGSLGVNVGDELVFGIRVRQTGVVYFVGSGARNPDGKVHANLNYQGANSVVTSFEDVWGGGDHDYNDNVFLFEGGLVGSVPEPNALALLGIGLICAVLVRRRRLS